MPHAFSSSAQQPQEQQQQQQSLYSPSLSTTAVSPASAAVPASPSSSHAKGPFVCPDWLRNHLKRISPPCQHKSRHGPYLHETSDTLPMELRECYFWRYSSGCKRHDCNFEHRATAHGLCQGRPKNVAGGPNISWRRKIPPPDTATTN